MRSVSRGDWFERVARKVAERLEQHGVKLTLGGEPSYVPVDPQGAEWSITALGPTKLRYAYALADALLHDAIPGALVFYSPGKLYPGELNPRWALHLVSNRDGSPMPGAAAMRGRGAGDRAALLKLRREILARLKLRGTWHRAAEPEKTRTAAWVLPLDEDRGRWISERWPLGTAGARITLANADGPAGLRLPLGLLPDDAIKRALVLEPKADGLHIFFPPLLQRAFHRLIKAVSAGLRAARVGRCFFEGYVPDDEGKRWSKLALTADPGVLEVNLPPCATAREYDWWMQHLERCGRGAGLRSFKQPSEDEILGTGGGNHLLFGGPTLEENPFFRHPQWVAGILRYWQQHPSLSYLFSGSYVGPASQAPRPDESAGEVYNLEMAYRFLEGLTPGEDHRQVISETLRHLHIDRSGNTHRSETSFDKFWNTAWEGGCRGLIEFRAIETLPDASWMSAVALLWTALAAFLFDRKNTPSLMDHGERLQDAFFLPTPLWRDFEKVLGDLRGDGFKLDAKVLRAIWEYRFPPMLVLPRGRGQLTVRRALEGWPLLCETPLEGGNTSRFVDTSMERLEFTAHAAFASERRVFVQGRELRLVKFDGDGLGAGLRYRRTALKPSLHPGLPPHMPLNVTITDQRFRAVAAYELRDGSRRFTEAEPATLDRKHPCARARPGLWTCDLRLD